MGSSSLLVKIYYFVLIRKIGRIKNRLILTGIFIELGVIEIEYELNKINVFTKIDEEPYITGICTILNHRIIVASFVEKRTSQSEMTGFFVLLNLEF